MDIVNIADERAIIAAEVSVGNVEKRAYGIFMESGRSFNFKGYRRPGTYLFLTEEGDFIGFTASDIEVISEGDPITEVSAKDGGPAKPPESSESEKETEKESIEFRNEDGEEREECEEREGGPNAH